MNHLDLMKQNLIHNIPNKNTIYRKNIWKSNTDRKKHRARKSAHRYMHKIQKTDVIALKRPMHTYTYKHTWTYTHKDKYTHV